MSWEQRNSRRYYYRKRRHAGRVVSEYLGAGPLAEAASTLDALEQQLRRAARRQREAHRALDTQVNHACDLTHALTSAALLLAAHHTHKGQWRQKRNAP